MSKLNLATQQADIIASLGRGETQVSIAERHSVSKMAISKVKKANEEKIERINQGIVSEKFDEIYETVKNDIDVANDLTNSFKEDHKNISAEKVAYKSLVVKSIINPLLAKNGIHNSPAFAQINIDNSKHVNVDPAVFRMVTAGFGMDIEPLPMNEVEAGVVE